MSKTKLKAAVWGVAVSGLLALLVVAGSRNLQHFDAALVGYTFATLFATFGITYRYAMWLQRPPTRMYWVRGWQMFTRRRFLAGNLLRLPQRLLSEFAGNRFIFRRGFGRGMAHWLIMWGCVIAICITFPLVFGWIHFTTVPGDLHSYRVHLFGFAVNDVRIDSFPAFLMFHGLVWAAFLVIPGVMLAMRRRMADRGAEAVQQFGEDFLPLILLFAISITGLMLTASYTWMKGYGYDFLAILHAITVIFTLLWLPFGKFFHLFQRPAQLGVSFYQDAGEASEQATCARCGQPYASAMMMRDLTAVQRQLDFQYEMDRPGTEHYQQICPRCRRALFGLAQSTLWQAQLGRRLQRDPEPHPEGPPHGNAAR